MMVVDYLSGIRVIRSAILALLVVLALAGCATGGPRMELSPAAEGPRVLLVKGTTWRRFSRGFLGAARKSPASPKTPLRPQR